VTEILVMDGPGAVVWNSKINFFLVSVAIAKPQAGHKVTIWQSYFDNGRAGVSFQICAK